MRYIRSFALFWWDFIVGDDYRVALSVVVLLSATAVLSHAGVAVWWLLPTGVVLTLAVSVFSVARRNGQRSSP
jgi:hypothetical protein